MSVWTQASAAHRAIVRKAGVARNSSEPAAQQGLMLTINGDSIPLSSVTSVQPTTTTTPTQSN